MENTAVTETKTKSMPVWARIVLVLLAYLILSGIFQVIGALVAGIPLSEMTSINDAGLGQKAIIQFFGFLALVVVMLIFMKNVDREPILAMGLSIKNRMADIGMGFILALLLLGGGTLILMAFGYLDIENITFQGEALLYSFLLFIMVAVTEEVLARGYILKNLMSVSNKFVALTISAVLFSLFHILNANFSLIPFINIFLAGILLGASYIYTKNLWFPISLHLFWNFFQGPIFGYAVSGHNTESLLTIKTNGSEVITGGEFGFEGSLICSILLVVLIGSIFLYYHKKEAVKR